MCALSSLLANTDYILEIFVTNLWGNSRFEFDAAIANFQRHNDLVRDQALLAYFELDRQRAAGNNHLLCPSNFTALIHNQDIEQRRNAKSVKMLQNWLSTGSVSTLTSLHNHRLQELHPGTCKWLTPPLKTWLSAPDTPCFWIEGPPGCGKSFLLSFAANHVAQGISTDKSRATVVFCTVSLLCIS